MNRISDRIENIFAQAVALEQSGKLKSTIYCLANEIFILNADNTILLRFLLRQSETPFKHPVSFRANDYDSRSFYEEDGKIIFVTENENFVRTKSCSTPGDTPEDIKNLYASYPKITDNRIVLNRQILSFLDDSLSHIEIGAPGKVIALVQRNIYSGSVIEVKRKTGEGLTFQTDNITEEFGPIGLRTDDFSSLFTFIDSISFCFPSEETDFCSIRSMDNKVAMEGIIATCVYDELGSVNTSRKGENNAGREITQEWRGVSSIDSTPNERPKRRCR